MGISYNLIFNATQSIWVLKDFCVPAQRSQNLLWCRLPFLLLGVLIFSSLNPSLLPWQPARSASSSSHSILTPWTTRYGESSSVASTAAEFAMLTTWNSFSSKNGASSIRTSLIEQFDSGVFDCVRASVKMVVILSTDCRLKAVIDFSPC